MRPGPRQTGHDPFPHDSSLEVRKHTEHLIHRPAGPAPYLDYRPIADAGKAVVAEPLTAEWLTGNVEAKVMRYAIEQVIPRHVDEVKARRLPEIDKVGQQVTARLR